MQLLGNTAPTHLESAASMPPPSEFSTAPRPHGGAPGVVFCTAGEDAQQQDATREAAGSRGPGGARRGLTATRGGGAAAARGDANNQVHLGP